MRGVRASSRDRDRGGVRVRGAAGRPRPSAAPRQRAATSRRAAGAPRHGDRDTTGRDTAGFTPSPPAARWPAGSAGARRRRPAGTRARPAAPRPPRRPRRPRRTARRPARESRKWCTVLCTRRSSATNQKSMVPRGATTRPMMPVSSSTSRTAACSAVSPASMCPFGSDHSSRPRRSSRPIRRGRAGGVVDDEATGRGLVDGAHAASIRGRPAGARRSGRGRWTCGDGNAPTPVARRAGVRCAASVARAVVAAGDVPVTLARRVPCSCPGRVRPAGAPRPRARPAECGRGDGAAAPGGRRARRAVRRGRAPAVPGGRQRPRRAARPPGRATWTSPPTPARPPCWRCCAGWADAVWETGIAFGTVGARRTGVTWRSPRSAPTPTTGSPATRWSRSARPSTDDLVRRDFTVNAMAVELTGDDRTFVDPHGGLAALAAGVLDTPADPGGVVRRRPAAACCGPRGSSPSSGFDARPAGASRR